MENLLTSVAYAFGGKEARGPWMELYNSTFTEDEALAKHEAEERELEQLLAIQRAERHARFLQAQAQGLDFYRESDLGMKGIAEQLEAQRRGIRIDGEAITDPEEE